MESKKPWLSKTIWTNLLMAVLAFFPDAQDWIADYPQLVMLLFVGVNVILRLVTKGKIELRE